MSFNKVSPAQGVLRRKESETESIELDLIQSFPVGVKETIKQRRSNQLGNIKIDDTSRIIMSETPETPSTGAVGRYWKWSHLDVTRTPSNSSTTEVLLIAHGSHLNISILFLDIIHHLWRSHCAHIDFEIYNAW